MPVINRAQFYRLAIVSSDLKHVYFKDSGLCAGAW